MDPPRKSKERLPFYQAPEHVKTSARIIQDARNDLQKNDNQRNVLRPISTKRPETPQEGNRRLFSDHSSRDPTNRPPSAFSLGSHHFDSDSRPPSGTRLLPLDTKPRISVNDPDSPGIPPAPKPPADPNRPIRRTSSRTRIHQQISVEPPSSIASGTSLPTESLLRPKSGSLIDVSVTSPGNSVQSTPESHRRVHSGPKDRTRHREDRSESDAVEAPRVDSGKRRRSKDRRETDRVEGAGEIQREGSAGSHRISSAGKSGSAGRREEETADESHYYNIHISPIVDKMTLHTKERAPEQLVELSEQLYVALDEGSLLGKACKRRSVILKTVFKLLDLESPKLLLKLARLILALKVGGNNLINVCKLVFKVAREEKNDILFLEGNLIELSVETVRICDLSSSAEALVYLVGALKFLSGNSQVVKLLVKKHCIDALAKLLVTINKTTPADSTKLEEQYGHILVQLTAMLRNLADISGTRSQFLAFHVVDELCKVMQHYSADGDLMLNVARIFSKLTLHTDCISALSAHAHNFQLLLSLLNKHQKREDLVVRVSYTLGNLTSKNDEARLRLFEQERCLDTLLTVFKHYCEVDLRGNRESGDSHSDSQANSSGSLSRSAPKIEDVLIKVIRVIANLSINEEIGPAIASSKPFVDLLILSLKNKKLVQSEELLLNIIATVNNLSFYNVKSSAITARQLPLAECLMKFMQAPHVEGLKEATRVYGNLSREKTIRDFLVKHKVDEFMVTMLDSQDREVVFTAVGVLINLMVDEDKRPALKKLMGIPKLVCVLRDFGQEDWTLASMACQTLWNYSGKIPSTNACFGEVEGQELISLLEEYLDEESMFSGANAESELQDIYHEHWESEFCPVAIQLLSRLEQHQSHMEPLEHPS